MAMCSPPTTLYVTTGSWQYTVQGRLGQRQNIGKLVQNGTHTKSCPRVMKRNAKQKKNKKGSTDVLRHCKASYRVSPYEKSNLLFLRSQKEIRGHLRGSDTFFFPKHTAKSCYATLASGIHLLISGHYFFPKEKKNRTPKLRRNLMKIICNCKSFQIGIYSTPHIYFGLQTRGGSES